jgi:hypothetical protein
MQVARFLFDRFGLSCEIPVVGLDSGKERVKCPPVKKPTGFSFREHDLNTVWPSAMLLAFDVLSIWLFDFHARRKGASRTLRQPSDLMNQEALFHSTKAGGCSRLEPQGNRAALTRSPNPQF